MPRYLLFLALIILGLSGNNAAAVAPTEVALSLAEPNWTGLMGVDDAAHSLSDLSRYDVVVVAVTCNHCPIAIEYYDRMKQFAAKHSAPSGRAVLVAISVSDLPTDQLPRMKEMSQREQFNFMYLHDPSQLSAKQLGATVTPQFFVLDKKRSLRYRGAWDNNINPQQATERYVEDAVTDLLSGRDVAVPETRAKGCSIDYH